MPELTRKRVLARSWGVWLVAWAALPLSALPSFAWSESVPASLRSCAAETDPGRRLACYDREIARFPEPAPRATTQREPVTNPPTGKPERDSSSNIAAAPAGNDRPGPRDEQKATQQDSAEKDARHLSARVVSIDRSPNELVLHLDNGQAWQQVQAISGDLSLQPGDTVKIDKQLGSYWLTGPYVRNMKVRQTN
jgi:hypothetical protein